MLIYRKEGKKSPGWRCEGNEHHDFAEYQAKTTRKIPVVVLTRNAYIQLDSIAQFIGWQTL